MATIGNLIINIGAKIDGLRKGLNDSTSLIQGAQSKFEGLGKTLGTGLKVGAMAAGGALLSIGVGAAALGPQLVSLGSDAEEMLGKFNVVFAQTGGEVTSSLEKFGEAVGRNKFELMGYAATLGDTLKPMGFTEEAAASTSVELVKLATDLSSFNNMPMDEALQRLQGTLIGSHENALAFGVVINENTLKAELARNGWDQLTGAQLEQAKVQARINLLMQGTTDAQGDAERTAGSWANQMRALQATLAETGTEIGLKLLPVITPLLTSLAAMAKEYLPPLIDLIAQWIPQLAEIGANIALQVMPWLQAFADWFISAGWPAIQQFSEQVLSQLIPGLQQLATWAMQIAEAVFPYLVQAGQFVIEHFDIFGPALAVVAGLILALTSPISAVVAALVVLATAWANDWGGIQEKTQAVVDFLTPYIEAFLTAVLTFWNEHGAQVMAIVQANWDTLKTIVSAAIEIIKDTIGLVLAVIQGDWDTAGQKLGEIWTTVWESIKTVLANAGTSLINAVSILVGDIVDEFSVAKFLDMGNAIIQGIIKGMKQASWDLFDYLIDLSLALWETAKEILKIGSPSQLFADQVGLPISQGIAQGIGVGEGEIDAALNRSVDVAAKVNLPGGAAGGSVSIGNLNLYGVQDARRLFEEIQREAKARGVNFAPVG